MEIRKALQYKDSYDEPWTTVWSENRDTWIVKDRDGDEILSGFGMSGTRAEVCVNALAGCPDPRAFIGACRAVLPSFMYAAPGDKDTQKLKAALDHPDLAWLREIPNG